MRCRGLRRPLARRQRLRAAAVGAGRRRAPGGARCRAVLSGSAVREKGFGSDDVGARGAGRGEGEGEDEGDEALGEGAVEEDQGGSGEDVVKRGKETRSVNFSGPKM